MWSAPFKPRVSTKPHPKIEPLDILSFFQQLATLFRSGTPIYDAITISSEQCQSTKLRTIIDQVARKVAAGEELNEALGSYPDHFRVEWVQVIRSGEASGKLGSILDQLVIQIDAASQMRSKIVSAMMYPCIMMSVALIAVAVMLVEVVPTFAEMFDSLRVGATPAARRRQNPRQTVRSWSPPAALARRRQKRAGLRAHSH